MATPAAERARKIGYARALRGGPELQRQREELERFGCSAVFACPESAPDWSALHAAISSLRPGDLLVVWSLFELDMPTFVAEDLVARHGASIVQLATVEAPLRVHPAG
jgi:hypothetical protein